MTLVQGRGLWVAVSDAILKSWSFTPSCFASLRSALSTAVLLPPQVL